MLSNSIAQFLMITAMLTLTVRLITSMSWATCLLLGIAGGILTMVALEALVGGLVRAAFSQC